MISNTAATNGKMEDSGLFSSLEKGTCATPEAPEQEDTEVEEESENFFEYQKEYGEVQNQIQVNPRFSHSIISTLRSKFGQKEEPSVSGVDVDASLRNMLLEMGNEEPVVNSQMAISFQDLNFVLGEDREILAPISGYFECGSMVALMGPSGSGKSTLLDMLAAKKTASYTGKVYVNGNERHKKLFTRLVSYVPQYDYGSGLETVWESVKFVSDMKSEYGSPRYLKANSTTKADVEEEKAKHIDKLLKVLGLSHIKDSRIGDELVRGISGGQRRRVTLAKGLVVGPSVLFGDEITSGLSATDSEQVIRAIRNVCDHLRVTAIIVVHQPRQSVFEMFDHLVLLTDGKCVYNGPRQDATEYFTQLGYPVPPHVSEADHFLDVITPGAPNANPDYFVKQYADNVAPLVRERVLEGLQHPGKSDAAILQNSFFRRGTKVVRLPWYSQVGYVTSRGFRILFRDVDTLFVMVIAANIFMGLIIGLVYLNIRDDQSKVHYQVAYAFTILITAALSAMNNIPLLVNDRVIFQNERAEGLLSTFSYMVSRTLQSTVLALVSNFILILFGHFLGGFEAQLFPYMWALAVCTYFAIDSLVAVFVVISPSPQMAQSVATLVITILTIFNGYTANMVSSPAFISWINYISPFFWSFWGAINCLFGSYNFGDNATPGMSSYEEVLALYGFKPNWEGNIIAIQLAFAVVFRFFQYLGLQYCSTLKK